MPDFSWRRALIGVLAVFAFPAAAEAAPGLLADAHAAKGLQCASCHKETPPASSPAGAQCMTCHGGYDKLARLTDKPDGVNPHESHLGEPECGQCHHGHKPSELACSQCHEFQIKRIP